MFCVHKYINFASVFICSGASAVYVFKRFMLTKLARLAELVSLVVTVIEDVK